MSAPPPVPALPDSARITTYTITAQTGPFAVGFQLYGDGSDYGNWIQVWLGAVLTGTLLNAGTDYTLSSATGPLASIPRPITDATITLAVATTGTLTIIGAQRPRRLTEFAEGAGVAARDLNQIFNTVFAELREGWDKLLTTTSQGAAQSATQAAASAASATASAASATANAASASTSAAAASAAGKIFASTSAGIAGTTSGQYFYVPGPAPNAFSLYLNSSGTAVLQATYPSLATFAAAFNSGAENMFGDLTATEFIPGNSDIPSSVTAQGDGTFVVNTTAVYMEYNATGRLAPGNFCSFAVKPISIASTFTPANSHIRFTLSVGGPTTFLPSAAVDAFGYYSVENIQIPANATGVEVWGGVDTVGDRIEVVFCPSLFTYAGRNHSSPRPAAVPIVQNTITSRIGLGFSSYGQAAQVVSRPDGSGAAWNDHAIANGGTISATTLNAVLQLETWLRSYGLIDKLVYLNPRCGSNLAAALTPLIDRYGYGKDRNFSVPSYSEGSGLSGGVVDLGINPAYIGVTQQAGYAIGFYSLTQTATPSQYIIGTNKGGNGGTTGLFISSNLLLLDWAGGGPGRAQGSITVTAGDGSTTNPTLGMMAGLWNSQGLGGVYRNGVLLGQAGAVSALGIGNAASNNLPNIELDTTNFASGGDFIGRDMTDDDIVALTWMLHAFNKNINVPRAVTADGLF